MTYPHREFNDDHTPLAYLITFRWKLASWRFTRLCWSFSQPLRFTIDCAQSPLVAAQRACSKTSARQPQPTSPSGSERSHQRGMQNSAMAIVDLQHSHKPRAYRGDCELWSGNSSQHIQKQRHSQDERGRLLAKPGHSVGQERQQETSLDGAAHDSSDCLRWVWAGRTAAV